MIRDDHEEPLMSIHPTTPPDDDAPCAATLREDPMADTAYCQERGPHRRHTSGSGSEYYAWLDGDEGAGTNG